MSRLCSLLTSSIAKKIQVALAGLFLSIFLMTHLAGNLFLFVGEHAFNHYAQALASNPLLPIAEIGLTALFLVHIIAALIVQYQNAYARPISYAVYTDKGGRTLGSSTMRYSGLIILVFLVIHLRSFRFADDRDGLFKLVTESFHNKAYSLLYIIAMGALGLHLSHGVQSAFQTFGVNHPRWTPLIKKIGLTFATVVALGFSSMPIWFGLLRGGVK